LLTFLPDQQAVAIITPASIGLDLDEIVPAGQAESDIQKIINKKSVS
jgi:hypothetical protein